METQFKYSSPVGTLFMVTSEKGLSALLFSQHTCPLNSEPNELQAQVKLQLDEYFKGKRTKFNIPFDLKGTEFQKKVWKTLSTIPYGKTLSYKEVAEKIKNPKAVRAVGGANGKNPICIIIPCHRVIANNGTLGGYSGGLDKKIKLLKVESIEL